ncbi:27725_t:CDS:2, partial [Dentiscutata erythropus]
ATNIKLYAVKEHTKTQDHTDSCKKNEILNTPPEHIKSLMKIIYCLAKNDIPLNKFSQLAHLGCAIGAPDLVSENHPITYENNTCAREMLFSISTTIEKSIWEKLNIATAIGIIVDKSTDISTESHLIIYVKYLINGIIKIRFLSLLQIENSDAKSIYNTITNPFVTRKREYLNIDVDDIPKLGPNINKFFITVPSRKDTKIGSHYLIWTPNQENDLLADIM